MTEKDAAVMVGAWDHIISLNSHGAKVIDVLAGKIRDVSLDFYFEALEACRKYAVNAIYYEMMIPETDEKMGICVWKNGHVDSGSEKSVITVMDWNALEGC